MLDLIGDFVFAVVDLAAECWASGRDQQQARARRASHLYCVKCNYNLTGTLSADRPSCPECGEPVRKSQARRWRRLQRRRR